MAVLKTYMGYNLRESRLRKTSSTMKKENFTINNGSLCLEKYLSSDILRCANETCMVW